MFDEVQDSSILLIIAGGSASGKSTVAELVKQEIGNHDVSIIPMDSYYLDLSEMPYGARRLRNYDCPAAIDADLLEADLLALKAGRPITLPDFDFVSLLRRPGQLHVTASPVLILEGHLGLSIERIANMGDIKVFLECPEDIRLERRLLRDVAERGRTEASVRHHWQEFVLPGYESYVGPSKALADVVVASVDLAAAAAAVVGALGAFRTRPRP